MSALLLRRYSAEDALNLSFLMYIPAVIGAEIGLSLIKSGLVLHRLRSDCHHHRVLLFVINHQHAPESGRADKFRLFLYPYRVLGVGATSHHADRGPARRLSDRALLKALYLSSPSRLTISTLLLRRVLPERCTQPQRSSPIPGRDRS